MNAVSEYHAFIDAKHDAYSPAGFDAPVFPSAHLFPFQTDCTAFALRNGCAALFEDCGLGKTRQFLTWAAYIVERVGSVLILCPLAVAGQIKREAESIGVDVAICRTQADVPARGIAVANYEMLSHFEPTAFAAVVLDEASIIKSYTGKTKVAILSAFERTKYKLACTATPSPNDLLELLNQAEFLGILSSHEAIARWFTNTDKAGKYRLRHWARDAFWDWVTSWARCLSKPSDIGFSDDGFVLPGLRREQHVLSVDVVRDRGDSLFRDPNLSATMFHKEGRRTAEDRAARVAELVSAEPDESWIIWCDTDYDDDAVRALLPSAVSVRGSGVIRDGRTATGLDAKERAVLDFCDGTIRHMIAKPRMFGLGLNLQHCARMVYARPSYSYEQTYQSERRCFRFGQSREVHSHTVMASTEVDVYAANRAKAEAHEAMVGETWRAARRATERRVKRFADYVPTKTMTLPTWIHSAP